MDATGDGGDNTESETTDVTTPTPTGAAAPRGIPATFASSTFHKLFTSSCIVDQLASLSSMVLCSTLEKLKIRSPNSYGAFPSMTNIVFI